MEMHLDYIRNLLDLTIFLQIFHDHHYLSSVKATFFFSLWVALLSLVSGYFLLF